MKKIILLNQKENTNNSKLSSTKRQSYKQKFSPLNPDDWYHTQPRSSSNQNQAYQLDS